MKNKGETLNNTDRAQWIDNHEPLYIWWRNSHLSKTKFIQANRTEIDAIIRHELNRKPIS